MIDLEEVRIGIPKSEIRYTDEAGEFFEFLPNNQGLSEEYLYTHQPLSTSTIPIYSTSSTPIGKLDDNKEMNETFHVLSSPAIIVARKGYAGRMFVVEDGKFIVHEDAYAVRPKKKYKDQIDLYWFSGHYSVEFQGYKTSSWGIGDFPRSRFKKMKVIIPSIKFQKKVVLIYIRRDTISKDIEQLQDNIKQEVSQIISGLVSVST